MKALLRALRATPPSSSLAIRSTSRTHVGRVRSINEDRVLDDAGRGLWAVADGMGGHSAGDVAADTLIAHLRASKKPAASRSLVAILVEANALIHDRIGGDGGTTVVALSIENHRATICWAGDSRAYLIRAGELTLLSHDHSLVQEMLDAGAIDADQAAQHPRANVITSALGISVEPRIDLTTLSLKAGDRLLLCSDGLSRSLTARDLKHDLELDEMADRLMTNALQRDGSDNISLVLVDMCDCGDECCPRLVVDPLPISPPRKIGIQGR